MVTFLRWGKELWINASREWSGPVAALCSLITTAHEKEAVKLGRKLSPPLPRPFLHPAPTLTLTVRGASTWSARRSGLTHPCLPCCDLSFRFTSAPRRSKPLRCSPLPKRRKKGDAVCGCDYRKDHTFLITWDCFPEELGGVKREVSPLPVIYLFHSPRFRNGVTCLGKTVVSNSPCDLPGDAPYICSVPPHCLVSWCSSCN